MPKIEIELDFGNFIDIAAIIVNVILAIYLTKTIQNKLTNSRSHKDYLIENISNLSNLYNDFIFSVLSDKENCKNINSWFKHMTMQLETMNETNDYGHSSILLQKHLLIRNIITGSNDYNDQFSQDAFIPNLQLRNMILANNKRLKLEFHECIKKINMK